jgi:hypothetical protein
MGKQSLTLLLVAAVFTVNASSQEIVIEPTNGRAQTTNHLSRPPAEQTASAQPKKLAPSADHERAKVKKAPASQSAAKREEAPVKTKPVDVASEAAVSEAVEAAPTPKKVVVRQPAWAMADTRDAATLQNEIAGALAHDPALAGSEIQVVVDDRSVTLEGRAAGSQHLQAQRLAKSYAWNRKLVDHIVVEHTEVLPSMAAQK